MENRSHPFPDLNHLSLFISTILVAYTLTHFVSIPALEFDLSLLGIIFPVRINFTTLVAWLVAGLTASGTAWLLQDHPSHNTDKNPALSTAIHWLLPSLTALVLFSAINLLSYGAAWWVAALGSGLLLTLVLTAEYIVMDNTSRYYIPAEMGITGLSIVLFLILAISLHSTETRLFYRVPIICLAALLVYLRIQNLRKPGRWALIPGAVSFLVIGQIAAGLHYWPVGSVGFGLALTGSLLALVEIHDILPDGNQELQWTRLIWPILILIMSWGLAIFL
jgi:hypothetical protein